jgi:hypothetical protein
MLLDAGIRNCQFLHKQKGTTLSDHSLLCEIIDYSALFVLLRHVLKFADLDVAEPNRVSMILKTNIAVF